MLSSKAGYKKTPDFFMQKAKSIFTLKSDVLSVFFFADSV